MITAITIENFKGIGDRCRLELKPLTLLFGPNSGGKSSVLQAIHYAREVLERRLDADRTLAGGESIDLGGFASFVHSRDLGREIRLRFELDLRSDKLPRLPVPGADPDYPVEDGAARCVARIDTEVLSCWVELAIAWDDVAKRPNVIECSTGFDGETIASIYFDPNSRSIQIADINFKHPLFSWRLPPEKFPEIINQAQEVVKQQQTDDPAARLKQEIEYRLRPNFAFGGGILKIVSGSSPPWEGQQEDIDRSRALELEYPSTLVYWYHEWIDGDLDTDDLATATVPLTNQPDALPPMAKSLTLAGELFEETGLIRTKKPKAGPRDLGAILTHMLAAPVEFLRKSLAGLRHLGPLRRAPTRSFAPQRSTEANRGASGLSAWDLLTFGSDESFVVRVSEWMSRKDRLDSGIRIERKHVKRMPAGLRSGSDIRTEYERAPTDSSLVLIDTSANSPWF